jgi:hypothetical protein
MFEVTSSGAAVAYVAPITVAAALTAIAAYLSSPPSTQAARSAILAAISKYNDLVALLNAVAA